ncbi:ECF transporter S component [Lactobacillus kefiranofaciens]|uniref:ECF transporter S component n=1 Tax=Lactobacillus kefiranofaciens TaxID=267818 RepID=A0AAX3UF16_9LACO|nr:ECF transporter S component [Lactobacillus kefiranofaciens]AEG40362.1 Membrane protein [Lactobacillus kefiranofaciens subsp. kefiranofaciens]KRL24526.1 membrane protein [Lactobacillus kefiranofaciens subsp. kefirgranum DSM 10550 = JCM 8572]KRM21428.1 membrane protein [Lactobacillus kefiranofaciens subsp. kefiranofaciens DSM 5016 = JCM 6985]MCJ2172074.1 ECF transporter S component [Lactobacillus kefiranofaciens]MCP9329965.1 ECF transporter S component [Lactobacillus kefiranofaciens]
MEKERNSLQALVLTGLFAAIIYIGIWILRIPVPAMVGRPFIHFGNTLTAVAILYLGYRNGMIAGIIGLGGFDLLNGYAATSWLTMIEVVVVASILTLVYKGMHYRDSKRNIIILGIIAGITKIFTTYCVSIVEALMVGTSLKVAYIGAFVSLPATVINSISTAICTPILYFAFKDATRIILKKAK